jgi:hypothetical protein
MKYIKKTIFPVNPITTGNSLSLKRVVIPTVSKTREMDIIEPKNNTTSQFTPPEIAPAFNVPVINNRNKLKAVIEADSSPCKGVVR